MLPANPLAQPIQTYEAETKGTVWEDTDKDLLAEIDNKYTRWRESKHEHEIQWYINAAFTRNLQYVEWDSTQNKLQTTKAPRHRVRLTINQILSKDKARKAKFLKNRPTLFVVPASSDRDDKLDAEATKKAVEYIYRKESWENLYRSVLGWSSQCAKGFVWLHWDASAKGTTSQEDPLTGQIQWVEVPGMGDIKLEVGSPFEILPSDPGIPNISDQPEFMRVKLRELEDVQARYPEAEELKGDVSSAEVLQYQKQIANLAPRGMTGYNFTASAEAPDATREYVVVKELFTRPCAKYEQGRYVVSANGKILRNDPMLPFDFWNTSDPYPVVEFADMETTGQFWPTTIIEQLIPIQKEYNFLRSRLSEYTRLGLGPKLMAPMQSNIPKNAYTSEPFEIIRYQWYPGLPEPKFQQLPNLGNDIYNSLRICKAEFDEVSNLFPQAQGDAGGATSGFQTNLLQEATDSVHAPDIRLHEIAFEKLCRKIRHIMKMNYDVPRLMPIVGRNLVPEAMEFFADRIDESAEIIIMSKSALSSSPAIRTQQVIELWNSGMLGDRNNPKTQARAFTLIDAEGIGELQEEKRRDQDLARYEIDLMNKGDVSKEPQPYEDHDVHWTVHTDFMKSPEYLGLLPEVQQLHKIHLVIHSKFIDPFKSVQLALDLGLPELAQTLQQIVAPPQPPPPGAAPPGPPQMAPSPQAPPGAPLPQPVG
jgi:hypothetical protein